MTGSHRLCSTILRRTGNPARNPKRILAVRTASGSDAISRSRVTSGPCVRPATSSDATQHWDLWSAEWRERLVGVTISIRAC
jgi:hypothetical protein